MFSTESNLKFKDYKSSNAQFLGSERTPRLLNNLNSNLYKWNTLATSNVITNISNNSVVQWGQTVTAKQKVERSSKSREALSVCFEQVDLDLLHLGVHSTLSTFAYLTTRILGLMHDPAGPMPQKGK